MQPARRAAIILLSTTLIWGSTFFSMKLGIAAIDRHVATPNYLSGILFLFLRFTLAAVLFALIVPKAVRRLDRQALRESFIVALPGIVGIALQCFSLRVGSSATVAFLTSLMVVAVPLIGWLFLKQRLNAGLWIGGILALAGVTIMTDPFHQSFLIGDVLTLLGAVIFGIQIHFVDYYTKRNDPEAMTLGLFLHSAVATLLFLLVMAPGMLAPSFIAEILKPVDGPPLQRWAVAWTIPYHAILASIVAIWAFMRFQRDVQPTQAAIIYTLEPGFAAVLAWMLAGEDLSGRQIAGGLVILAGNLACELFQRREPAPPVPSPVPPEAGAPPGRP